MSEDDLTPDELARRFLQTYRAGRRPANGLDLGPRTQTRATELSPELRELRDAAAPYQRFMHDLILNCLLSNIDPLCLTAEGFAAAKQFLIESGLEAVNRSAGWYTALRGLSSEWKARVLHPVDWTDRPQSPRRLNAPSGTFAQLEAGLADWKRKACRPLIHIFEKAGADHARPSGGDHPFPALRGDLIAYPRPAHPRCHADGTYIASSVRRLAQRSRRSQPFRNA